MKNCTVPSPGSHADKQDPKILGPDVDKTRIAGHGPGRGAVVVRDLVKAVRVPVLIDVAYRRRSRVGRPIAHAVQVPGLVRFWLAVIAVSVPLRVPRVSPVNSFSGLYPLSSSRCTP